MELIDTHAHLASGRLRGETAEVLRRAEEAEVRRRKKRFSVRNGLPCYLPMCVGPIRP